MAYKSNNSCCNDRKLSHLVGGTFNTKITSIGNNLRYSQPAISPYLKFASIFTDNHRRQLKSDIIVICQNPNGCRNGGTCFPSPTSLRCDESQMLHQVLFSYVRTVCGRIIAQLKALKTGYGSMIVLLVRPGGSGPHVHIVMHAVDDLQLPTTILSEQTCCLPHGCSRVYLYIQQWKRPYAYVALS